MTKRKNLLAVPKVILLTALSLLTVNSLFAGELGKMTREVWNSLPGSQISDFTSSPRYWQTPDSVTTFSGARAPTAIGNAFAARVRAIITAPATGNYTFWIASDDSSELWLSPTVSKFGRVRIASVIGVVGQQAWDVRPTQKSALIPMVAGQRYFIEALHKDEAMADHLSIAWQVPGGSRELISASALESFTADPNDLDNDELPDSWETANGFDPTTNGTVRPDQHPLADPDQDGYTNLEEAQLGLNPTQHGGLPGALLLETWKNLPGPRVADLTNAPRFVGPPDTTEFIFSAETPPNRGDLFGFRLRGFVIPPVSGNYTFRLAGDDSCELWLSPSASQFNKRRVAWVEGFTAVRNWSKYPSQRSANIPLIAGQKYYLEARGKEQIGGDHLSIGWTRPGVSSVQVIPASHLESYAIDLNDPDGDNLPNSWEIANRLNPTIHDAAGDPDRDGISNFLEYESGSDPNVRNTYPGALTHAIWWNVPGDRTASLDTQPRLLKPADVLTLAPRASGAENQRENYAQRLRGHLTAPITGTYTFWAAGDDQVDFFLSTSESQFNKELLIRTSVIGRSLDTDISQKSRTVQLVAGQRYYLEIRHIDSHQGDYCDVAWQVPGGIRDIIPGSALSSFIPTADDMDDDGLPDAYELANGLSIADNGSLNPANGAHGDRDGDGLSNTAEWKAGTRADLTDSDGDGLNDRDEVEITETQALMADAAPFESITIIPGASFSASSGSWLQEGGKAKQNCVRGWLDYPVTIPVAGVYQLDLAFTPIADAGVSRDYEIVFSADGDTIQRGYFTAPEGASGNALFLTPWLTAGSHNFRVFIDNSYHFRRIAVDKLKILASRGPDLNSNGTPDWVELRLLKYNSIEAPGSSLTSPVCLEGKAKWSKFTKIAGKGVAPAPNDRWYVDVPLDSNQTTAITASLENGSLTSTHQINWVTTNLLSTTSLNVRLGDSLKLSAFAGDTGTSNEIVTVMIEGKTFTFPADQPLAYALTSVGTIPIQVTHSLDGNLTSATSMIEVVAPPEIVSPVCLVGHYREVVYPALHSRISNQLDSRIEVRGTTIASNGNQIQTLRLKSLDDRVSVFRLGGVTGPVLGSQNFRSMRVRSGTETALIYRGQLDSSTSILEIPIVLDGLHDDVVLKFEIFISGVFFDDGSLVRSLKIPLDFSADGRAILTLFKTGAAGSTCYRVSVMQLGQQIAYYN